MDTRFNRRDALCGAVLIAVAAAFALGAAGLETGTARRMGPGYFPLMLSGVLALLGALILAGARRSRATAGFGDVAWRGMACILPAPVLFGLTVRGLGLAPAIALTVFVAALASRRMTLGRALLTTAAITVFAVAVFSYALGLPYQRVGPWLRPLLGG